MSDAENRKNLAASTEVNDSKSPALESFHSAPWLSCGPCHRIIPVSEGNPIADYLCGRGPRCPSCAQPVDVWASILTHLDTRWQVGDIPLGPINTHIIFELPKNGRAAIVLAEHGIPKDARILDRRYCGQSFTRIFPIEIHGGAPQQGPIYDGTLMIYGATFPEGTDAPDAEISKQMLTITWAPSGRDVEGWSSLSAALEAFAKHDYQGVVIPANTAVELVTDRAITSCLEDIPSITSKHLSGFLSDVTYGHRLNVLLPAIVHFIDAPRMAEQLHSDLNELKTLRNQVGHQGKTKHPVSRNQAARMIRASMFGFHYMHVIETRLFARRTRKAP